jgi:hypothetical protein
MGDSENEDKVVVVNVDDSVGKTPNETSMRVFMERLPRLRELLNAVYRKENFPEELIPKAGPLLIVILDRIVKLALCNLKESNVHFALYSARTS